MTLHERSSADHATGGPSGHVVGRLGMGEQLLLWALRQRLRDGEPASPALAAFEALFRVPDERAAGPAPWLQPGVRLKAVRLDQGRAAARSRKGRPGLLRPRGRPHAPCLILQERVLPPPRPRTLAGRLEP